MMPKNGRICPRCNNNTLYATGKAQSGKQRYRCGASHGSPYCYSTTSPTRPIIDKGGKPEAKAPPMHRAFKAGTKRFIITSAQNATPVHVAFFESLKRYASYMDAELVVIPTRYKNPTSRWTDSQAGAEWWDPAVVPYLCDQRKKLCANLVLVGDVKVQPTASTPLTGFEGLTHGESCILGHSKIQLKVVPVAAGKFPKILTTTGACTVKNYTDSKAGKLGEFHHSLGACIAEIDGKFFHLRQVTTRPSAGTFTDLNLVYSPEGMHTAPPALGLVCGDLHHRFLAPGVRKATFEGKNSMLGVLNPGTVVFHDVSDGHTHNPHHEGDPFIEAAKAAADMDGVRDEVAAAVAFVDQVCTGRNGIIVPDNHGDFLRRWIIAKDWREIPGKPNKDFYLETARVMLQSARMGAGGVEYLSPFAYWVGQMSKNKGVRALHRDEPFTLGRFQCGMHGHEGPNGSRGSIKNLSRLGSLVISGHGHTPGWEEGHRRVGVSTGKLEYESGPSSHLQTHCVVYADGSSSLLTIIGDQWHLTG